MTAFKEELNKEHAATTKQVGLRALIIVLFDFTIFVLFGFLFLIPQVVIANMVVAPLIFTYSFSAVIKTKGRSISAIIATILVVGLIYLNFMMLFGNLISNALNRSISPTFKIQQSEKSLQFIKNFAGKCSQIVSGGCRQ